MLLSCPSTPAMSSGREYAGLDPQENSLKSCFLPFLAIVRSGASHSSAIHHRTPSRQSLLAKNALSDEKGIELVVGHLE